MKTADVAVAKLAIEAHLDLLEARRLRKFTVDFIIATQELINDLAETGDWQKHKQALAELTAREGIRMNVPSWFWRIRPGEEIESQIRERAEWLASERYGIDDAWDLLSDLMRGLAAENGTELSAARTKRLLESVLEASYGCARCA